MLAKKIFPFLLFLIYAIVLVVLVLNKKMLLFLHPDFLPLAYFALVFLFIIALAVLFSKLQHNHYPKVSIVKMLLLALPVLFVMVGDLRPLSSVAALERGLDAGALTIGRRAISGQFASKPENRTLYQWVIALNADPEPSHYEGQKVRVRGFVLHDDTMPPEQVAVAKFILTCCAADARVLSLPVLKGDTVLTTLPNDAWVDIEGTITVHEWNGDRGVLVVPSKVTEIAIPENPYEI